MTYSPKDDAPMPIDEQNNALDMLNAGEITLSDFEWLHGAEEPEISDVPRMTPKDRRRFFAIQAANNRRFGIVPPKKKRRKKAS